MATKPIDSFRGRSVDPQEVAFYDHFAAAWWDPEGVFWPIHGLNDFRIGYIRDRLTAHFGEASGAAPLAGLTVLDVGCGGGLLAEAMAGLGAEVVGIDVSERNIEVARLHAGLAGVPVRYELATAEALAAAGRAFDGVLSMEVVEHVSDLDGFLQATCRLVRPGGVMVVATINRTFKAWLTAIIGAERILGWLPKGSHQYHKLRRPEEVAGPLASEGLVTAHRTGVALNPFTRRFRFTRSLAANYMLTAVRPAPSGAD
jgi:2-polyprenyl-6-hydroxyphenyl methylase/3-demethylubiquinone-9 3-methyltransferase